MRPPPLDPFVQWVSEVLRPPRDPFALGAHVKTILRLAAENIFDANAESVNQPPYAYLHKLDNVECVYGKMVSGLDFRPDTSEDESVKIPYIIPFTLPCLCSLQSCLGGMEGCMILYADEVVPGNNKRCDGGRKYVAMYWSLAEFLD